MDKRPIYLRIPAPFAVFLALVAAGCAPSYNYEPITRQPVPTLSDQQAARERGVIIVQGGDTLYALARRHGVPLRGLIDANRLSPPYTIYPGQRLSLPQPRLHVVRDGETVYAISRRYGIDMGALVRVNDIPPPYRIERGQKLRLPAGTDGAARTVMAAAAKSDRAASLAVPRPAPPEPIPASLPKADKPVTPNPAWDRPDPAPLKAPPPRSRRKFLWPVRGKVIVGFGARRGGLHNDGINIAASDGTEIQAAENGVVAYVGNQLQGFGNLILIKHGGGWMSAYAHTSILLVKRGDVVRRGQVIARVGRTGNVNRPQLHFELRRGDRAVDPRRYLVRLAYLDGARRIISAVFPDGRPAPG